MQRKGELCPMCPNHCSRDTLKCGKGQAYFRNGNDSLMNQAREHGKFCGAGLRHFQNPVSRESLFGLFMECGHHVLRHIDDNSENREEMFEVLSSAEKAELSELLKKLLVSWHKK